MFRKESTKERNPYTKQLLFQQALILDFAPSFSLKCAFSVFIQWVFLSLWSPDIIQTPMLQPLYTHVKFHHSLSRASSVPNFCFPGILMEKSVCIGDGEDSELKDYFWSLQRQYLGEQLQRRHIHNPSMPLRRREAEIRISRKFMGWLAWNTQHTAHSV